MPDQSLDELLAAMVPITLHSESRGRDFGPNGQPITSPKGARYAMQVMPTTMADPGFGVRPANPNDPADVNRAGRDYLGAMMKRYDMDPSKAWAAYNGGPGRVDRATAAGGDWLSHMPAETRNYVANNTDALSRRMPSPVPPATTPSGLPTLAMLQSATAQDQGPVSASTQAPATPAPPDAPSGLGELTSLLSGYQQLDQDRSALRQQQLTQATAALQQQRKGLSAMDLFRLSAALASPTQYRGFGGVMANVMPVLGDVAATHEAANKQRIAAMAQLQGKYMGDTIDDHSKSLSDRLDVAKAMVGADKPDRNTWSEQLGRFVSPDKRQVIGQGVHGGQTVLKYSDGTLGIPDADGSIGVYDAAGRMVGRTDRQGNTINDGTTPAMGAQ
jgi:hypothetical protein